MNIADAVNPYFFQLDTPPIKDPAPPHLIATAGKTTIYSVLDRFIISNDTGIAGYATVVADERDLVIYGLDVVLAGDLGSANRGPTASRNIRIYCRTLEILGTSDPKHPVTIDVSGAADGNAALASHILPDKPLASTAANTQGANGDDIAYALNNPSPNSPYTTWFSRNPGKGWATKGAKGGAIDIACETLVLNNRLRLRANGAKGNAGVGGQNVQNWFEGNVGGNAGKGGSGGDSGSIRLTCNNVVDADGKAINLTEWVQVECSAGQDGDPGLPGSAYDATQKNYHYGSYAGPVDPGESAGAELIQPGDLHYNAGNSQVPDMRSIADVSMVATGADLHFWSLLYHRAKIDYLQRQPMKFAMPSAIDPGWVALGKTIQWSARMCFAYGDTTADTKNACIAAVACDPDLERKNTIARALKQMQTWYLGGKTMWGHDVATVMPLSFESLCNYIDEYYPKQQAVRDFYIKLRTQLADAIKTSADLNTMSNAAEYAVQMHDYAVKELKALVFGTTDHSGVDAGSLIGQLNAAANEVDQAIAKLEKSMPKMDKPINDALGIGLGDVLGAISSMAFVIADPPAFAVMGAADGLSLYDKAKNKVTDDSGNSVSKAAVISKLHTMKGNVDDLKSLVEGIVPNGQVGKLDEAILTSLDNIDAYVSKFTNALGDVAKEVMDEVADLRKKVNFKNDLWLNYNDKVYQLAKEWEDYESALAAKQAIDDKDNPLSANLINAVQLYTGVYLNNLERTADLWAKLVRKYAYVTLNATLQDNDLVVGENNLTSFWNAEATAAQGMADQANDNLNLESSAYVGKQSGSLRNQLAAYNASTQSVVLHAPDLNEQGKGNASQRSAFWITIMGNGSAQDQALIRKLLSHESVWLQVVPGDAAVKYIGPPPSGGVPRYAMQSTLNNWDIRITHINPWIEGIKTNLPAGSKRSTVGFHVKLGTKGYITSADNFARYFDYNLTGVNTDFEHYTDASIADATNADMTGGGDGAVSDSNVDKRGLYAQIQLRIPDVPENAGLAPVTDISQVKLRIYFRVIFRAVA